MKTTSFSTQVIHDGGKLLATATLLLLIWIFAPWRYPQPFILTVLEWGSILLVPIFVLSAIIFVMLGLVARLFRR